MNTAIKTRIDQVNSGIAPEGYEKTSFGIFPCDWVKGKLKNITSTCGGGTPSKKNNNYWEGNIPWISSSDLIEGKLFHIKPTRFITHEAINKSATKLCPSGSIAVVTRVGVGKLVYMDMEYCTSQDFTNIVNSNIIPQFLLYILSKCIHQYLGKVQGTSIKGITTNELSNIQISYPSTAQEQARIAEILMEWDKAIDLQEQYINKLETRKKALMQKLLTPKEGWSNQALGYYFEKEKGKNVQISSCGKLPIIDMDYTINNVAKNFSNSTNGVYADNNEIIILWDGASAGKVLYGIKGIVGSTFCVLRQISQIRADYVYYYLDYMYEKHKKLREGSGIPHMPKDFLQKQIISAPTKEHDQKLIADILSQVDKEISLQRQKLDKLILQRKAMQQYLLTGIVRV